ncbi:MAG TPA: undecaprenyl-phosphate glucose phosphotransferase [Methylophaga sp.]|jgi:putative colanic acid biosynthesis UDP-glucose lipid carrier transferase|uniref:undecaprenyl-phosphate glucose phosphotransferase n=1 Tax=unclassified Methylophaga TaxID=2629249 RepID=UPI000C989457|nr:MULTISPECIES: undecaprenyl-phosphate glucose phosphotransferase [unclassified Methylophaga]MAP27315.1 undecaprenyl-phosphate glucose phosphotransferase [Methylophaga sp.]HAD32595.1 undecaprenyl-phosphate glucose phosphotransferase [Methylophaga sp.]|tara:strand:+ start:1036 stop:2439 length:1404 start_codon:yes stop_codon:yes gene_type:complete
MAQGKIRHYDSKINAISRLIDSAIILVTFLALMDLFAIEWQPKHVWSLLFSIILFHFFAESQDAYRSWRGTYLRDEVTAVLFSWGTSIAVLVAIELIVINEQTYATPFILIWIIATPIELISWHAIVRMVLGIMRSKGLNTRRVAIVGATKLGYRLEKSFDEMEWTGYRFSGFYDDRKPAPNRRLEENAATVLGSIEDLIRDCRTGKIDIVFITLSLAAEARIRLITEKLADTTASVYLVPDLFTFNLLNSRWVDYQGITAISIYETPFAGIDSAIKRIEDIVLSFLILCLIAIPMLLIAIGIKATSKGPVFFKQTRYGMDGEKIKVWKFRTMTVAEDGDKVIQAQKNDQRVTHFGKILRRTSLDELPQFFNSLGGSMSIVGPRPHAVAHNEEYRAKIQGYMLRHKVKPGITGLAQINGFRGETDTLDKMEGRIKYDLQYIQTWTLLLDLKIILLTITRGFVGKDVY